MTTGPTGDVTKPSGVELQHRIPHPALLTQYARLASADRLLPVQVPPHYARLIDEEVEALGSDRGPLYKVAYPTPERINLRVPGEVGDFVDDVSNMPDHLKGIAIRKYRDRLLYLISDRCAGHCMYCFRQQLLTAEEGLASKQVETNTDRVVEYLSNHPEIREVILSGGDPLSIPSRQLDMALTRLREVQTVSHIRVHTRNVIFAPHMLNDHRSEVLAKHRVRLVIHTVHPYELVGEVKTALERVQSKGVRCYSQFPILRGVNDHPDVLLTLLEQLDALSIRPLSLFIPDPVSHTASFRIPLARLFKIVDQLNLSTPSWINSVRLVLDTPIGKVRRENIVNWNHKANVVTFLRGDQTIQFHDLPAEYDIPGDINVMLWKSASSIASVD